MRFQERSATGPEFLRLATALLQTARLSTATGGMWEAADIQWWWRRDQHPDPRTQMFLMDGNTPHAAVVLTSWDARWQCDLLFASPDHSEELKAMWPRALEMMATLETTPLVIEVNVEEEDLIALAIEAGFEAGDELNWTCWMPASNRPEPPPLRDGFSLRSRAESTGLAHPMARRNGAQLEDRLVECSLHNPELDLAVYTPGGEVAGYSLYWADPVTKVGLVEPMRTEDEFQHQGVARHMLAVGLDRLASSGCTRLKVSSDIRLYLSAGFQRTSPSVTLSRLDTGSL